MFLIVVMVLNAAFHCIVIFFIYTGLSYTLIAIIKFAMGRYLPFIPRHNDANCYKEIRYSLDLYIIFLAI